MNECMQSTGNCHWQLLASNQVSGCGHWCYMGVVTGAIWVWSLVLCVIDRVVLVCVQLALGLYKHRPQNRLGYHISLSDHDGSQGYQCSCVSGCVFIPFSGCARSRGQLRRSGSNSVSFNTMSMPCVCLFCSV